MIQRLRCLLVSHKWGQTTRHEFGDVALVTVDCERCGKRRTQRVEQPPNAEV